MDDSPEPLPEAPLTEQEKYDKSFKRQEAKKKRGVLAPILSGLVLLGLLLTGTFLFLWTTTPESTPSSPSATWASTAAPSTTSPSSQSSSPSPKPRTITQAGLDKKMPVAAFHMARGSVSGGNQVLNDFLNGTTCTVVYADTAHFMTKKEANEQRLFFKQSAKATYPQAFVGAAVAKMETYALSGKWLLIGLILSCP